MPYICFIPILQKLGLFSWQIRMKMKETKYWSPIVRLWHGEWSQNKVLGPLKISQARYEWAHDLSWIQSLCLCGSVGIVVASHAKVPGSIPRQLSFFGKFHKRNISGFMYKCYFRNYTIVAKVVRKKLLMQKFWVQISLNIVFLLLNFTIIRPSWGGGRPPPRFLTPPLNQKFYATQKIC